MEDKMSSQIEEIFVYNEIKNLPPQGRILEFGCGDDTFPNRMSDLGYEISAIDLFKRKRFANFNFIQSDFLYIDLPENYYDAVYALSSFEHIGLEQGDILPINDVLHKISLITKKIKSILKYNGIFLTTMPFGDYRYFYVDKDGWSYEKKDDSLWGVKVYDIKDIYEIFKDFSMLKKEFYLRIDNDYMNKNSWILIDHGKCYLKKELTDSIVCLKLINNK